MLLHRHAIFIAVLWRLHWGSCMWPISCGIRALLCRRRTSGGSGSGEGVSLSKSVGEYFHEVSAWGNCILSSMSALAGGGPPSSYPSMPSASTAPKCRHPKAAHRHPPSPPHAFCAARRTATWRRTSSSGTQRRCWGSCWRPNPSSSWRGSGAAPLRSGWACKLPVVGCCGIAT